MSYFFAMGACCVCQQLFSFNPDLVPSLVINGEREPVCLGCVTWANQRRKENGLELFTVLPGAYQPQEE